MSEKYHKRVTWRVQYRDGAWFGVVMIGEARITKGPYPSRKAAKDDARVRAAHLRNAGR